MYEIYFLLISCFKGKVSKDNSTVFRGCFFFLYPVFFSGWRKHSFIFFSGWLRVLAKKMKECFVRWQRISNYFFVRWRFFKYLFFEGYLSVQSGVGCCPCYPKKSSFKALQFQVCRPFCSTFWPPKKGKEYSGHFRPRVLSMITIKKIFSPARPCLKPRPCARDKDALPVCPQAKDLVGLGLMCFYLIYEQASYSCFLYSCDIGNWKFYLPLSYDKRVNSAFKKV